MGFTWLNCLNLAVLFGLGVVWAEAEIHRTNSGLSLEYFRRALLDDWDGIELANGCRIDLA